MKKIIMVLLVSLISVMTIGLVTAKKPNACTTIQDGGLVDSKGNPISVGYDQFGYNYQAYMFNGRYCDYDRVIGGAYCDVNLIMKWNDAWLSNKDCDGDGKLDRYYGFASYIGSGAWLTNHQSGTNEDGTKWTYFVKIVAKPTADFDCASVGGTQIWGAFCRIQQVSNDPASDEHGVQLLVHPAGFGAWK